MKGCSWRCADLLKECFEIGGLVKDWSVSLVSQRGNKSAYFIAANAMRSMVAQSWLVRPPSSLNAILVQDRESIGRLGECRIDIG